MKPVPDPTAGVNGFLTTSSPFSLAIPADLRVSNGSDGIPGTPDDIIRAPGAFTLIGGVANVRLVASGADHLVNTADDVGYSPGSDGVWGTSDDVTYTGWGLDGKWGTGDDVGSTGPIAASTLASLYSLSGSYGGNSSTSLTIEYTYVGNGGAAGTTGSVVAAWGGHIATRLDWGSGLSAAAISGSPFQMRLTGFVDNDPKTSESVGNQDRSLSSAAVTFPASITITKQTSPDGSPQSFNFELTRPAGSVDVIGGKLDLSGDGQIPSDDTGRFVDNANHTFTIVVGSITAGGSTLDTYAVINQSLDVNNSGTITIDDSTSNIPGTGVVTFSLADGRAER